MHINCPFLINIQVGNYSHTFTNSFHHNYLNNFKQFIAQYLPDYPNEIAQIDAFLLTNVIVNNQYYYLKNYFLDKDFIFQSQINNPDNFSLLLNEIINY